MTTKDWVAEAAREYRNDPQHVHSLEEIIRRHCPFKQDVVYVEVVQQPRGHIRDWATSAAEQIASEHRLKAKDVPRIAAVVAYFAEPLTSLLAESRREHEARDDSLNDCPILMGEEMCRRLNIKHECDCGAEEWNRRIDEALK